MTRFVSALLLAALLAAPASAQDLGEIVANDTGDTAWILTASALVLLMTLPGLALFYGGLVRSKNFLSVALQTGAVASIVSVLWIVVGYTFAFGDVSNAKAPPGSVRQAAKQGVARTPISINLDKPSGPSKPKATPAPQAPEVVPDATVATEEEEANDDQDPVPDIELPAGRLGHEEREKQVRERASCRLPTSLRAPHMNTNNHHTRAGDVACLYFAKCTAHIALHMDFLNPTGKPPASQIPV